MDVESMASLSVSKHGGCLRGYQKSSVLVRRGSGSRASGFRKGEKTLFGLELEYQIQKCASCIGRCCVLIGVSSVHCTFLYRTVLYTDWGEFGALHLPIQDGVVY